MPTKILNKLFLFASFFLGTCSNSICQVTDSLGQADTIQLDYNTYQIFKRIINNNLIAYADSGNYSMVQMLLDKQANPNYTDNNGVTALMYAADKGYYKIAELLVNYGADVNAKPNDGNSAIFAAIRNNHDSIAELLIENKANINEYNEEHLTPLHYAAGYGYPYLAELLISNHANINVQDQYGNTPLMTSVYVGALYVTQTLIESGANVNLLDNDGNSTLTVAAQFNDTLLIKNLVKAGAEVNVKNKRGISPLMAALENNSTDAFKLLVDLKASTELPPKSKSYYQLANEKGYSGIAIFLDQRGLKTKLKFNIDRINLYAGFSNNKNELMLDFGGGVQEAITKSLINFGFRYRPISNRFLVYYNNNFYQFWEKRYSFYLSFQHLLTLKRIPAKADIGFIPGFSNELTWRYYRGVSKGSGLKYLIVPSIGIFYQQSIYAIIGKWEFANYNKQINTANRFSLQFIVSIPTSKRYIKKKINWVD